MCNTYISGKTNPNNKPNCIISAFWLPNLNTKRQKNYLDTYLKDLTSHFSLFCHFLRHNMFAYNQRKVLEQTVEYQVNGKDKNIGQILGSNPSLPHDHGPGPTL